MNTRYSRLRNVHHGRSGFLIKSHFKKILYDTIPMCFGFDFGNYHSGHYLYAASCYSLNSGSAGVQYSAANIYTTFAAILKNRRNDLGCINVGITFVKLEPIISSLVTALYAAKYHEQHIPSLY